MNKNLPAPIMPGSQDTIGGYMSLLCAALVQVSPKPCTGGLGTAIASSQLQKHEPVIWERDMAMQLTAETKSAGRWSKG